MSGWWRRLALLCGESRIRLPPPPLAPADLQPGDRLTIGTQSWRLAGVSAAGFELEAIDAAHPTALLTPPAAGRGGWTLRHGDDAIELPSELIARFPAGADTSKPAVKQRVQ